MNEDQNYSSMNEQEKDFTINDVMPENEIGQNISDENLSSAEAIEENNQEVTTEEITEQTPEISDSERFPKEDELDNFSEFILLLKSLKDSFAQIEEKFDKKIADDAHKNALFDKMYEELASYKKDLYAKLIGPFINETISLLDDYERLIERIDTIDYEKLKKYVIGIPDDLESILDNNGVERYTDDTEKFNPKTQRVVKTIPTGNMELENVIAERTRKGYRWNGVMLKPEMVKIYKYKEGFVDPVSGIKQEEPNAPDNYSCAETVTDNNQN